MFFNSFYVQRRRRVWRFRGGPGEFIISGHGCLAPTPNPCMKKNLSGFLRFAWTPLGSSGGSGPLDPLPPASYAAVYFIAWTSNIIPSVQGKFVRIHFGTNGKIAGADIETCKYEGRSKSFEPNLYTEEIDWWAYIYFSALSPPLSMHNL